MQLSCLAPQGLSCLAEVNCGIGGHGEGGGVRFHWTDLSGLFSHANLAEGEVAQLP